MTPADRFLGLDVGTTACKAVIVDAAGAELAFGRAPTPWERRRGGTEASPDALVEAALAAAVAALEAAPGGPIAGVGVTSIAETGVLVDRRGEPVAPALAWHDPRGAEQAAALAERLGRARFAQVTGLGPSALCSLAKYRWLRETDERTADGVRWLSVAEWVVRRLGGEEVGELSLASRTGMLSIADGAGWAEALDAAGAPPGLLPAPAPAGTPAGRVARGPRALAGAVLCVGGHDHLCAVVGAGATGPGDVLSSCGTAEALVAAVAPLRAADRVRAVEDGLSAGWHVLAGRHAVVAGFRSGATLLAVLDLLGVGAEGVADLDAAALADMDDLAGLEVRDADQDRLLLTGVGRGASPVSTWRAALAAVARHGATMLARVEGIAGPRERLVVTGGWARSGAFRAAKRAAVGTFEHVAVQEAGARGAALLAAGAAGAVGAGLTAVEE